MSSRAKPGAAGVERRRAGSAKGARTVKDSFASVITRKAYCERVGIHPTTLRRWEQAGIVTPTRQAVRNILTYVFSADDVRFGRRLAKHLAEHPGSVSLVEAAHAVARRR